MSPGVQGTQEKRKGEKAHAQQLKGGGGEATGHRGTKTGILWLRNRMTKLPERLGRGHSTETKYIAGTTSEREGRPPAKGPAKHRSQKQLKGLKFCTM